MTDLFRMAFAKDGTKVLIALKDLLPGQEILQDRHPLLHIHADFAQQYATCKMGEYISTFDVFDEQLCPETKAKVCGMMTVGIKTTMEGPFAAGMRSIAKKVLRNKLNGTPCTVTKEMVDQFVKVSCVYKFYSVQVTDGSKAVFEILSHFSHSCQPNCVVRFDGTSCIVRTVLLVKQGEELTLQRDEKVTTDMSTCARRQHYLSQHEFVCHCVRCEMVADDTRQFHCFNSINCIGSHFVCQPFESDREVSEWARASYDFRYLVGEEYVEPFLLPCTVCDQMPPLTYQQDMLIVEAQLPAIALEAEAERAFLHHQEDPENRNIISESYLIERAVTLISKVQKLNLPPLHRQSGPILKVIMLVASYIATTNSKAYRHLQHNTTMSYKIYLDNMSQCTANDDQVTNYYLLAQCLRQCGDVASIRTALTCAQTALRMYLLLNGRKSVRDVSLFKCVADIMAQLGPMYGVNSAWQHSLVNSDATQQFVISTVAATTTNTVTVTTTATTTATATATATTTATTTVATTATHSDTTSYCAYCAESTARTAIALGHCARCRVAQYCTAECHKAHWKIHKYTCQEMTLM